MEAPTTAPARPAAPAGAAERPPGASGTAAAEVAPGVGLPAPRRRDTALVLAGGGVSGLAWELGVLAGIADADPSLGERVLAADVLVGTSAGASVAVQVASGVPLGRLVAAQLDPRSAELAVPVDPAALLVRYARAVAGARRDAGEVARRLAALPLGAPVDPAARRAAVAARLPVTAWPARELLVVAVDADRGERVVLDAASGVELLDAVLASSAVPGVWPVVEAGGRRLVDGGALSLTHADLAAGAARVLVVEPHLAGAPRALGDLDAELAALAAVAPAAVCVIAADEASLAALGPDPLGPAARPAAVRAGRLVGRSAAARLAETWG